ncbi:transposase [Desulfarculales bacterium]
MDTGKQPHKVFLEVAADRGAEYSCPEYGRLCKAHDFHEFTWRPLNFFQHHGYVTAAVDEIRKAEAKKRNLHKATSGAVLKAADGGRLTEKQQQALTKLGTGGFATAWRFKEVLR